MSSDDLVSKMAGKVAIGVDRRGFLRRAARNTFITAALVSVGGVSEVLRGSPAFAFTDKCESSEPNPMKGKGCPGGGVWGAKYPCGPDRCCTDTSNLDAGCNCDAGGALCKTHAQDSHCNGNAQTWSTTGRSCWTCKSPFFSCGNPGCECYLMTTCCDCKTSSTCDSDKICISVQTVTFGPFCP